MTKAEYRMQEEKENEQYNPCFYCEKTMTCGIDCVARCGFNSIITAKLSITQKNTDEYWKNDFIANAKKYSIPISA